MKRVLLISILLLPPIFMAEPLLPPGLASAETATAEEGWRVELEELCSRSNNAMNFSRVELKSLVERCDKLKPRIDALDESSRKVYGRRLKMCRDFYAFMLETRKDQAGN